MSEHRWKLHDEAAEHLCIAHPLCPATLTDDEVERLDEDGYLTEDTDNERNER